MNFIKEDGTIFAVVKDAEIELDGETVTCEELLYAEIENNTVRWEDDWSNPVKCESLELAKHYVERNYQLHKPHVNGKIWK